MALVIVKNKDINLDEDKIMITDEIGNRLRRIRLPLLYRELYNLTEPLRISQNDPTGNPRWRLVPMDNIPPLIPEDEYRDYHRLNQARGRVFRRGTHQQGNIDPVIVRQRRHARDVQEEEYWRIFTILFGQRFIHGGQQSISAPEIDDATYQD